MRRCIWSRIRDHALEDKWKVGIIEASFKDVLAGNYSIRYISSDYSEGWFADPFVLDVSPDTITLLVEEFSYSRKRGGISKLVVRRSDMKLLSVSAVLSADTHLSFPALARDRDRLLIYPENSYAGHLDIYEQDEKTELFVLRDQLMDIPAVDAVLFEHKGERYLSCTLPEDHSGSLLHIFKMNPSEDSPPSRMSVLTGMSPVMPALGLKVKGGFTDRPRIAAGHMAEP